MLVYANSSLDTLLLLVILPDIVIAQVYVVTQNISMTPAVELHVLVDQLKFCLLSLPRHQHICAYRCKNDVTVGAYMYEQTTAIFT